MPLKPTFFRVRGLEQVHSGYYRPALQGTPTSHTVWMDERVRGDVFDALKAAGRLEDALSLIDTEKDTRGLTASLLCEFAMKLGEVLVFTADVDLQPFTTIRKGERCVVGRRHERLGSGETELFLELHHSGLDENTNCLWVIPHMNDVDILPHVRRRTDADNGPSDHAYQHSLPLLLPSTLAEGLREAYIAAPLERCA